MRSLLDGEQKPARAPYKIYVILAHVLLTLALTYPLVFTLTTHVIGPAEDNLQSLWNLWWVKHAILNLHTHPYFTDYLFYPQGASLSFHSLSLFNSLLGIPLQFIFNSIICYNLLILLSFVLSGWGMYLLLYQLTRHSGAAFVASLVFAYSPYHFAHAEHHLQLSSIQFIPFFILYLLKLLECPRLKHSFLTGVFLFLASLCSWYYLMCLLVFCLVFAAHQLFRQAQRYLDWRFWGHFLLMLLFFGILILPFIYPGVKEKFYGMRYFEKNLSEIFSADAVAFFVPPAAHPLAPEALGVLYNKFGATPWEATVFLGYVAMILAGYAIYKLSWNKTGLWVITGLIFGVLSLGPRLHVMGKIMFPALPMPYWLIQWIPFFNVSSGPSRFIVMVFISLAVLVGYALQYMAATHNILGIRMNRPGLCLIGGLILFEYMALPVNICSPDQVTYAPFIRRQLENDKGDYAILELPLLDYWAGNAFMYRQTLHHKRLLNGTISRLSHKSIRFLSTTPLKELMRDSELDEDFFIKLKPLLIKNRIKYVVLNHYLYKKATSAKLYALLDKAFMKKAELENRLTIFSVY